MPDGLTAPKAANVLGVSAATLKDWSARLGIGQRSSTTGSWVYTDDDVKILQSFQSLREDGHGLETITRKLRPLVNPEVLEGEPESETEAEEASGSAATAGELMLIRQEMVRVTDLAREYAQTAHRIGDLEATVRHLKSQLAEKNEVITESKQVITEGSKELENTRKQLVEAATRVFHLASRPWWRRLFG